LYLLEVVASVVLKLLKVRRKQPVNIDIVSVVIIDVLRLELTAIFADADFPLCHLDLLKEI
jgi:hypothetical protein